MNPTQQHLTIALEKKDLGNSAFRSNDMNHAIRYYHEAILYLRTIIPDHNYNASNMLPTDIGALNSAQVNIPKHILTEATSHLISLYANLAACHTRGNRWERVIDCSNKALSLDANHVKSLFRKGLALARLNRSDQAIQILNLALVLAPNDAAILKELNACKQRERDHLVKQKQELKGLFERGSIFKN